jgi:hypothetical protein
MSRGPGIVQRRLLAAFRAEPDRSFTAKELAATVYGEAEPADYRMSNVLRALRKLDLSLETENVGRTMKRGFRYRPPAWAKPIDPLSGMARARGPSGYVRRVRPI